MKSQQIVFVDSAVEDWQSLAIGVKAGIEVILVSQTRDGIEQIGEVLQNRSNIGSIRHLPKLGFCLDRVRLPESF